MARARAQTAHLLKLVGKLVARWNDLEWGLRYILFAISYDRLTAAILTADAQAVNLMNAVRIMASERDITTSRINVGLSEAAQKEGIRVKLIEPISPHVHHLLDCIDRLREFRNFYVHGITTPRGKAKPFSVHGITARVRLAMYHQVITKDDLTNLIKQTDEIFRYAEGVYKAILANASAKLNERPTWPKKPPLPDRLVKPRLNLQDELPPPQSLPD
jgi:hypothetical protein